ncbi:MAG: 6-carboxytetrahydropterin synthase [Cyclobacteriaceae bacterium]
MTQVRVTKKFTFETAHALYGYDGKCKNVHGHSYMLEVTLIGTPITDESDPKLGMVMDFGDLKKIVKSEVVNPWDHALLLYKNDPIQTGIPKDQKLLIVDYQPTCENMLIDMVTKISNKLPGHVKLHNMRLHETATAYAEWYAADNT